MDVIALCITFAKANGKSTIRIQIPLRGIVASIIPIKSINCTAKNNRSPSRSCSFPPNEVLPTASPADSSITGVAPVNNRRKRKQSKAGSNNVGRKRKQGTAAEDTGQRKDPPDLTQLTEAIEEGTADNANMNTRNLPGLCSTQQRNKTSASSVNEHLMFEEVHADNEESGDMGDSDDEGAEADIHNKGINLREVLG
jgi:hypothetical protein